jgi:hypothetical protein
MKLGERLTIICLARQDEAACKEHEEDDGRSFLNKFTTNVATSSHGQKFCLEDEFFILGRASKVFVFSVPTLSSATESISVFDERASNLAKTMNPSLGIFELHTFPAIRIECQVRESESKGIVPCLFFVRSKRIMEELQDLPLMIKNFENVADVFLGFGSYNLIFLVKVNTLTDLERTISAIRNGLKEFWETRTIIGVPKENLRNDERKIAASEPFHSFSIMAKFHGRLGKEIENDILEIAQKAEFSRIFSALLKKQEKITYRQGYMDVDVPCHSQTVSEVFDAACEIRRRVRGIFDTATIAKINLS